MGNPTHQNVNGLCEHHFHPQALLGEHQPCCHPPGDLPAAGAPGAAAPHRARGLWCAPRGALQCSAFHLQATELERAVGEFQQIPGTASPWGRIWPGCIYLIGKYWQALQLFQLPLHLPAQGSLPHRSHCSPSPDVAQGLGPPPAHGAQGTTGSPLAEGTWSI